MARKWRDDDESESPRSLEDGECAKKGDTIYCRVGDRIEVYPIDELRGMTSETAVISLILGIVGILLLPLPFIGISAAVLAVLFGGVAVYQVKRRARPGLSYAFGGMVMGLIAIVLFIAFVARALSLVG